VTDQAPDANPRPASGERDETPVDALGAGQSQADRASATPGDPPADHGDGSAGHGDETTAPPVDAAAVAADDPRSRDELHAALVEAEAARDEYLDDLRRARAEFDNYRRRMMREGSTQRDAGRAELAEGLLEVLDDLDRTLDAASASADEALAHGVELVATKLRESLEHRGLERIDSVEVAFDPQMHEAVQHRPDDEHDEPTVVEVLRPGYRWGERVLRAAMVVVAD
jgi:molecular chaperone GrpE